MFAGLIQYTLLTMPAIFARALRTNGIKEMSHGSSGEKQVISFFFPIQEIAVDFVYS